VVFFYNRCVITFLLACSDVHSTEPVFVNVYGAQESIPSNRFSPTYVPWRVATKNKVIVLARQARNQFLVSLKGLQIRAQYLYVVSGDEYFA
jgi:hypothetical protein